jgi:uncharacterized protein (DUF2062 family)
MVSKSLQSIKHSAAAMLRQGITPRRLALTLALGFAVGCFPVVGVTTAVCAVLALVLRLNLPAIQAANYAVMPLQVLLLVPFVRLGGWLFSSGPRRSLDAVALLHASPLQMLSQLGGLVGHAMLAWLVIAGPAVVLMTLVLTMLLRRVPAVAAAEAGD